MGCVKRTLIWREWHGNISNEIHFLNIIIIIIIIITTQFSSSVLVY